MVFKFKISSEVLIRFALLAIGLVFMMPSFSQTLSHHLKHKTDLCKETDESSGLFFGKGTLWTFDDSGGSAELFEVDTADGKLIRKVKISNASNIDWEAITFDEKHVYIGDIGNNTGSRKTLFIYRISKKELLNPAVHAIKADTIIFNYAHLKKRSVVKKSFYDCEAMFCFNDTLYLINKNWTNQSQAVMYKIPTIPGHYSVEPFENIATDGLVCDAALSPDKKMLVMIGYVDFMPFASLYKVTSTAPFRMVKISNMEYPKHQGLQTEGCAFENDDEILISCEKNRFFKNALYRINLK